MIDKISFTSKGMEFVNASMNLRGTSNEKMISSITDPVFEFINRDYHGHFEKYVRPWYEAVPAAESYATSHGQVGKNIDYIVK